MKVLEAILENFEEDLARSLNTLAKYNDGHWKSDKQAKFLQSRLKHQHNKHIQDWMSKHGYKGKGFLYLSKIPGTGTKDISKARYAAKLFIWDTGGVSHVIRMKYVHAKKGSSGFYVDWHDKGKETWKRAKEPVTHVDLEAENAAKAKENAPMIAKIKAIPDWESNNLLQSFIKQLEAGRKLSFKQLHILNKMKPEDEKEDLGQQEWAAQVSRFRAVLASFMLAYLDKQKDADIGVAQKWIANKEKTSFHLYTPSAEDQKALKDAEVADVEPFYEKKFKKYASVVKAFEKTGKYAAFEDEWSWVWSGGLNELIDAQRLGYLPADDPAEIFDQIMKKAMRKKPTKKSLRYIDFMLRAVKSKGAPGHPVNESRSHASVYEAIKRHVHTLYEDAGSSPKEFYLTQRSMRATQ